MKLIQLSCGRIINLDNIVHICPVYDNINTYTVSFLHNTSCHGNFIIKKCDYDYIKKLLLPKKASL